MIDIKNYNRIVAFGCSWTAGDELQDHTILNLPFYKCQRMKIKYGFEEFHNLETQDGKRFGTLIEENKSLNLKSSWAGKLAKNLNLDFLNMAQGGTCLEETYLKIIKFKKYNMCAGDLIVIGLTSPLRVLQWHKGKSYKSCLINNLSTGNSVPKDVLQWNLDHLWTTNNLALNYYKTIQNLIHLDKDIYFQHMRPENDPMYYSYEDPLSFEIEYLSNTINEYNRFLAKDSFLTMKRRDMHCGFGHHPVISHVELAETITKNILGV